jgi:branched-chain amino acid transport system ATP-binding protein
MAGPLLEVRGLRSGYGPVDVLHDVGLHVDAGEIVALIGANGAGKTTTLMTLSGIVRARAGTIEFDGQDLTRRSAHEIVQLGMAQSPEGRKIFPRLSVLENLRMGAFTRRGAAGVAADLETAFTLFPILRERQNQPGGLLSGGQQQMLAMAPARIGPPGVFVI